MAITMESDFIEYVTALKKAGACTEVVAVHDKMLEENPKLKVSDVYKIFCDGVDESWPFWALKIIGSEMDESFRTAIITDLIKSPMLCFKLSRECNFLTQTELLLLESKYGQDSNVIKTLLCLDAIQKNQEFNTVRVEAYTTCKSITEAKTLLDTKTSFATALSADTAVKSSDELKKILESERTKVTIATNLVMKEQGFVDADGNGSPVVFNAWYEGFK